MMTVAQVSKVCGVSIRTLHHYDAIGLLKPTALTDTGYRLYDEKALERLQCILLFRELQFPLAEIAQILARPGFSAMQALNDQIALLEMRRDRLDEILSLARKIQKTGGFLMQFSAFDTEKIDRYREEAQKRWGDTAAWQEAQEHCEMDYAEKSKRLMERFAALGTLRELAPGSEQVQTAIDELRLFISENFYTCTKEIFKGLGQMYTQDERFRQSIDAAGGTGTAEFAAKAIALYCSK